MDALKIMTEGMLKEERPNINIGDVVKVHVKIREGERERIQIFEGTIIARKGSGVSETFTVRRVSYGVGVEKVFPVNSPNVAKVELVRSVKFAEASFIIFVTESARQLRLKSLSDNFSKALRNGFSVPYFFTKTFAFSRLLYYNYSI